jgi:hypothetical protein
MGENAEIIVSVVGVGVVLLIALAGFGWRLSARLTGIETRIDQTKTGLEARIDQTKTGLEARIDQTKTDLEARIDQTETRLEARINQTEARIDLTKVELEARIDQTEARSEARFVSIESRLHNLGAGISSVNHQIGSFTTVLPTIFSYMYRGQMMDQGEFLQAMAQYCVRTSENSELLVDHVSRAMNPLTDHEATQLKAIHDKLRKDVFQVTREEAIEFNLIVKKIVAEHPGDFTYMPLQQTGWMLLGFHPGSYEEIGGWR